MEPFDKTKALVVAQEYSSKQPTALLMKHGSVQECKQFIANAYLDGMTQQHLLMKKDIDDRLSKFMYAINEKAKANFLNNPDSVYEVSLTDLLNLIDQIFYEGRQTGKPKK